MAPWSGVGEPPWEYSSALHRVHYAPRPCINNNHGGGGRDEHTACLLIGGYGLCIVDGNMVKHSAGAYIEHLRRRVEVEDEGTPGAVAESQRGDRRANHSGADRRACINVAYDDPTNQGRAFPGRAFEGTDDEEAACLRVNGRVGCNEDDVPEAAGVDRPARLSSVSRTARRTILFPTIAPAPMAKTCAVRWSIARAEIGQGVGRVWSTVPFTASMISKVVPVARRTCLWGTSTARAVSLPLGTDTGTTRRRRPLCPSRTAMFACGTMAPPRAVGVPITTRTSATVQR